MTPNSPLTAVYLHSEKLSAFGGSARSFGFAVAISGNTAVVGDHAPYVSQQEPEGIGSVYVYVRDGDSWFFQQKLVANDGAPGDYFGHSVDIDGDKLVIGAYGDDIDGIVDRGSAYVFTRSGSTWTQTAKLVNQSDFTGDNTTVQEYFGWSVAIDGSRIVVGARNDLTNPNDTGRKGSVSVFEGGIQVTKIRGDQVIGPSAEFGISVDVSGTTVIIGASNYPSRPDTILYRGAAFIYTPGVPEWIRQKMFGTPTDSAIFGHDVAISGNRVVIGAPFAGKVYASEFSSPSWSELTELPPPPPGSIHFGTEVSICDDVVAVGASSNGKGSAYVYRNVNNAWIYKARLSQKDVSEGTYDGFSQSLGIDSGKIIGGAASEFRGTGNRGSASIFAITLPRQFDFENAEPADIAVHRPSNDTWYIRNPSGGGFSTKQFGTSGDILAPADFDGDGKTDIAIWRPPTGGGSYGVWYVQGTTAGFYSNTWGEAGDIPLPSDFNSDGKADFVVYRPANQTWYWKLSSDLSFASYQYGSSGDVPLIGDFDGDQRSELAIFRPSTGQWRWWNRVTSTEGTRNWGASGDIPIPGDYDGDLKTDAVVFRPSNSTWYRFYSSNGATSSVAWGQSGDIPVAADYDADGETDLAVFRPGNNTWYIINSGYPSLTSSQTVAISFGASGDEPIPSAFLP